MDHIISLSQYQYVKNKYIYAGAGFIFFGGGLEYSWLLDMGSTVWLYHVLGIKITPSCLSRYYTTN